MTRPPRWVLSPGLGQPLPGSRVYPGRAWCSQGQPRGLLPRQLPGNVDGIRISGLCRPHPGAPPAAKGTLQGHPLALLGRASSWEPWEVFVTHLPWKCPFFPWAVASLPTSQERACWDSAPGEERADPRGNPHSWNPSCHSCLCARGTLLCCWCMEKLSHGRVRARARGSAVVVVPPCPGTGSISERGSTESDGARRGLCFGLLRVWVRCQQVLMFWPTLPRCCRTSCGTCTAC